VWPDFPNVILILPCNRMRFREFLCFICNKCAIIEAVFPSLCRLSVCYISETTERISMKFDFTSSREFKYALQEAEIQFYEF
jgi:hypothetical protein